MEKDNICLSCGKETDGTDDYCSAQCKKNHIGLISQ